MNRILSLFKYPICIILTYLLTYEVLPHYEVMLPIMLVLSLLLPYVIIPCFFALQAKESVKFSNGFLIPLGLCMVAVCALIINSLNPGKAEFMQLLHISSFIMYILNTLVYLISYIISKRKKENLS